MAGDPTVSLFAAVIYTALEDLLFPRADVQSQTEGNRAEALSFFTATSGPWARCRHDVCDVVGIDPDRLRKTIIEFLDGSKPFKRLQWKGFGKIKDELAVRNLKIAQDLWRNQNAPTIRRIVPEPENRIAAFEPESIDDIRARSDRVLAAIEARQTAA